MTDDKLNGVYKMKLPVLLHIDLRESKSKPNVCAQFSNCCQIQRLDHQDQLASRISLLAPDVICFEFDYPDFRSLKVLEQTKKDFPSIPILMVTDHHDEALAIWALRARVWDYLVKPVDIDDLYKTVNKLTDLRTSDIANNKRREIILPQQAQSNKVCKKHNDNLKGITLNVIKYVENHYHEKIYISELAEKCYISQHQFSRTFKREKGITFREYLVNYRIDKARELLDESPLSVGDVSYSVGFLDHSYFTRMFKRHVGLSPTDYRLRRQ